MSRFSFNRPDSIATVVAAKGKDYEVEFEVPAPVGKFYGDIAVELLQTLNDFRSAVKSDTSDRDDDTVDANVVIEAFTIVRQNKRFWAVLLPAALGLKGQSDEKEGIKYLDDFLTNKEILELFTEAAEAIISYSFEGDETKEALSKLEGGEGAEEELAVA